MMLFNVWNMPNDDLVRLETWTKILGTAVAVVAGITATFKALAELRRATEQRKDELTQWEEELAQRKLEFRHKQAVFARDYLREVFSEGKAATRSRCSIGSRHLTKTRRERTSSSLEVTFRMPCARRLLTVQA
jgi:hypothetical protein